MQQIDGRSSSRALSVSSVMPTPAAEPDLECGAGRMHVRYIGELGVGVLSSACDLFQSGTHAQSHAQSHACLIGTGRMRLQAHQIQIRQCGAHVSSRP